MLIYIYIYIWEKDAAKLLKILKRKKNVKEKPVILMTLTKLL